MENHQVPGHKSPGSSERITGLMRVNRPALFERTTCSMGFDIAGDPFDSLSIFFQSSGSNDDFPLFARKIQVLCIRR
jgi:hypothetical protein